MGIIKTIKIFNSEAINSLWIFLEKFSKILVSFILGVYLARVLGAKNFGIYTSAISFVTIFISISGVGLNGVLVREFVKKPNLPLVIKTSFAIRFLGVVIGYLGSILLSLFFIESKSVFSGIVLISTLIFFTPGEVIGFYFESELKSKYNAIAKSASFFIGAALKLALLFNSASLQTLFLAHVMEGLIWFFILFGFFLKKTNITFPVIRKTRLNLEYSKSLITQSWPLLVSSISVILYLKLDQVMILEYLGTERAGIYGVSVRVCEAIFLIPAIIVPSLFPKMIKLFEKDKRTYLFFMKNILLIFGILSISITLVLFLTSDLIIPYIFGNEYQESSGVLKIYSISILFVFFGHIISKWLIIEGHTKLSIVRHGMGLIINITLNVLLIPKYGIHGAALASVMAYFMSTIGFMMMNQNGRRFITGLVFLDIK